ncbi:hypothetical protein JCM11491_004635 [Sporobolomyces phaffii]
MTARAPLAPFPLYRLPTELVECVYASVGAFADRDRRRTLAALCLVDRFSLDVARPILYAEIRLDLTLDAARSEAVLTRLARTLEGWSGGGASAGGRKSVRSLDVTFTCPSRGALEGLYAVLGHVELRSVRTRWAFGGGGWLEDEATRTIAKKQPRLEAFERVPSVLGFESQSW